MDPTGMKPPMPEGMEMPPMMQQMMHKLMAGMQEFNPMAMCQAMMTSISKAAEMAAYATPEVRTLFEEWTRSVEEEILTVLKARGKVDLNELASQLKISPESALYFLGKLIRDGKAVISEIRPTAAARGH